VGIDESGIEQLAERGMPVGGVQVPDEQRRPVGAAADLGSVRQFVAPCGEVGDRSRKVRRNDAGPAVGTSDVELDAVVEDGEVVPFVDREATPHAHAGRPASAAPRAVRVVVGEPTRLQGGLVLARVLAEHDHVGVNCGEGVGDSVDLRVAQPEVERGDTEAVAVRRCRRLWVGEGERCGQHANAQADRRRHGRDQQLSAPERHQHNGDECDAEIGRQRLHDRDGGGGGPSERLGECDQADEGDEQPRDEVDDAGLISAVRHRMQGTSRSARRRTATVGWDNTGPTRVVPARFRALADVAQLAEARRLGRRQ
jgi:hypothetical protein